MNGKFVSIGEILWDHLPEAKLVGGAPFNVAANLHNLGREVIFISRVGKDWDGEELTEVVEEEGISTKYIQKDENVKTGKVLVELSPLGNATYDIVSPAAWDFIEAPDDVLNNIRHNDYVIFGSLAQRGEISHKTIKKFLDTDARKVFDVNLRAPHYSKEIVEYSMFKTDILKVNNEELELLSDWFLKANTLEENIRELSEKYNINTVLVSLGNNGSISFKENLFIYHEGYKLKVKDTVGAGDAFLAAYLSKVDDDINEHTRLSFANAIGAYVATHSGALPKIEMNYIMRMIESENGDS